MSTGSNGLGWLVDLALGRVLGAACWWLSRVVFRGAGAGAFPPEEGAGDGEDAKAPIRFLLDRILLFNWSALAPGKEPG